jgi:Ni,Fe-hydrogenase I large subunit
LLRALELNGLKRGLLNIKIKKLIEKIEGEAELNFSFKNQKIDDVKINFAFSRGIEKILEGKSPFDALVITPRVCGICNHAHLLASVRAIEDGYRGAGVKVELSNKARDIREFTLACEVIQNHIKWFYLTMLPQLEKMLKQSNQENHALKASYLSATITKALAIFAGQWPHSGYAVVGGVTCDPTYVDIIQAEGLIDESITFFEQIVAGIKIDELLNMNSVTELQNIGGDLGKLLYLLGSSGMAEMGKSHDRFIVFGECLCFKIGKSVPTQVSTINPKYVKESEQEGTLAKAVTYKGKLFEVGSLARGMISKEPIVKALHKRYKDSLVTRIFARIYEIGLLLDYSKRVLNRLDVSEPSCTIDSGLEIEDFEGVGVVEAARGSLIHKISVQNYKIKSYEIITPTQWNLSHGDSQERGIAIKSMIGSKTIEEATYIFRAFDVCSVCTTQ